jgi:hypothetical protein
VLSLIAVATVVVLSASFARFTSAVANRQAQAVQRKRAFYLAEAGLSESFAGFSCGKSGNVGAKEKPALLGDGVFWVQAVDLGQGVFRLDSTGMIGSGSAKLSLVVRRGKEEAGALGVFSSGSVSLGAGSLVDAYDSSKGDYSAQTDKTGAALCSNAAINLTGTLTAPTTVKGDVTPGTSSSVTTTGSVTISGSTTAAFVTTALPTVDVPAVTLGPAQVQSSPYPLVIPAGTVGYKSLTVQPATQVIIQGPAKVVLGSLSVKGLAQLDFDTTKGAVELYVNDAMDLATGSQLTSSGVRPEDVLIQVPAATAAPLTLRSKGSCDLAPNARDRVEVRGLRRARLERPDLRGRRQAALRQAPRPARRGSAPADRALLAPARSPERLQRHLRRSVRAPRAGQERSSHRVGRPHGPDPVHRLLRLLERLPPLRGARERVRLEGGEDHDPGHARRRRRDLPARDHPQVGNEEESGYSSDR